jgi:hypothetical protein
MLKSRVAAAGAASSETATDGFSRQPIPSERVHMTRDLRPLGHWPLFADGRDASSHDQPCAASDVTFVPDPDAGTCAVFERGGEVRVPGSALAELGGEVTVSAWICLPEAPEDALGTIVSRFDPETRQGFELGLQHGVSTTSQHNVANLEFGVDWGTAPRWYDCGQVGSSIAIWALAVHDGGLYAGSLGGDDRGHVHQFLDDGWADLGPVGEANSVTALASYDGALFAATTRYRTGGSGLVESANENPGGAVYRFEGGRWHPAGRLPGVDSVSGFAVYAGELYACALYQRGVFRHVDGEWKHCGDPGRRLLALGVFDGHLMGAGNDHPSVEEAIAKTARGEVIQPRGGSGGGVFAMTGPEVWSSLGFQPDTTQVYSLAVSRDRLHASTWPNGLVYRYADHAQWEPLGRLGEEAEVMGLITYNGVLYGGTLPHAQIYGYAGGDRWELVGTLDVAPHVLYRRAAGLAVYRGALFCGTLPSGRVHRMTRGSVVTHDRTLTPGWHHVTATHGHGRTVLYVDGLPVADRHTEPADAIVVPAATDLLIGNGSKGTFAGRLRDLRVYALVLTPDEVAQLQQEFDPRRREEGVR